MPQAQTIEARERRDKAIDEPAQSEQAQRQQQPALAFQRVEVGQRCKRAHVGCRKHVLRRLRHFQAGNLGAFEQRVPDMREIADDQAGFPGAQTVQILEHQLAVVERAERVHDHDEIERPRQRFDETGCFDVANAELISRVSTLRLLYGGSAQIDADAERGF